MTKPWVRVMIMLVGLVVVFGLSKTLTGAFFPSNPQDTLLFQGALLLVVLGSTLLEDKFTKPVDSVVNSLAAVITLVSVKTGSDPVGWWAVFCYCLMTMAVSILCVSLSAGPLMTGWKRQVARHTYRPAIVLGQSRLIFSVLFVYGLVSFYAGHTREAAILALFWGLFVVIWPLKVPQLISSFRPIRAVTLPVGKVVRTDWPDIVRVALLPEVIWERSSPKIWLRGDGRTLLLVPLYSQVQEESILGTAHASVYAIDATGFSKGNVYELPAGTAMSEQEIASQLGGDGSSRLVGFIVEGSSVDQIHFETLDSGVCEQDLIVWCNARGRKVYYQISNAQTHEETLENDRRGFQVGAAAQLGTLSSGRGFVKYPWVPPMNTPVFLVPSDFGGDADICAPTDFVYGTVPGTKLKVGGPLLENLSFHTAILGITGSGKTQLAFEMIRFVKASKRKVICIDLTSRYQDQLSSLKPRDLSLGAELATDLGQKLFDAETGAYGAGAEKKILKTFSDSLRKDIGSSIAAFLTDDDGDSYVGIIRLNEISNTKATLYITELYMTCLLNYTRDHRGKCPEVLVVVEEAHTVMPEPNTMGLADQDSRGLVSKIAQIALQGRKFGVGLLVIAQRTATVSKTVLTQCNTVVSLTCFDDTSLNFLRNIFGHEQCERIPGLQFLRAVVYGKGVRSERPLVVQIPFRTGIVE